MFFINGICLNSIKILLIRNKITVDFPRNFVEIWRYHDWFFVENFVIQSTHFDLILVYFTTHWYKSDEISPFTLSTKDKQISKPNLTPLWNLIFKYINLISCIAIKKEPNLDWDTNSQLIWNTKGKFTLIQFFNATQCWIR